MHDDAREIMGRLLGTRHSLHDWPDTAGVYAIFAKDPGCLPGIRVPPTRLVYVGKANNLKRRNHFIARESGRHTPRRSLGAILKSDLNLTAIPRGRGRSDKDFTNFCFTPDGEARLTRWMLENLECSVVPFKGDVEVLEKRLIRVGEPALNIDNKRQGWSNSQAGTISELRKRCAEEAESRA